MRDHHCWWLTFGTFGSLDNAKKTLSKIFFSTISSFSSLYKSNASVRQPKNNQTFGNYSTTNKEEKKKFHLLCDRKNFRNPNKNKQSGLSVVKWHVSVKNYLCIRILFFQIVPMLPERSIWCNASAGPNKNNRLCWIFW